MASSITSIMDRHRQNTIEENETLANESDDGCGEMSSSSSSSSSGSGGRGTGCGDDGIGVGEGIGEYDDENENEFSSDVQCGENVGLTRNKTKEYFFNDNDDANSIVINSGEIFF